MEEYQILESGKLYDMIKKALQDLNQIRQFAKDKNLLNSQLYLDFEDSLNKFSTMDPNG